MTAIVGIVCQDGCVIGADSSMTLTAGQTPTIEQLGDKIDIVGDLVIVAGTGSAGLGQRFQKIVESAVAGGSFKNVKNPIETGIYLSRRGHEDLQRTFLRPGQYGALVAFGGTDGPCLLEFDIPAFQPELKTSIWYASMGCGQPIVDPFLGLMREVFWREGRPSVSDAVFAAYWALEHAVRVNPGGVGGPVRIATLTREGAGWKARRLADDELQEHAMNVEAAKEHLRGFRQQHEPTAAAEVPVPPQASAVTGAS